ncbi:trypsin zeta-like [Musca vetustissima]|uniref:trypsin zeta-like n=1 Tax=Musca vetustissima TaxID=27455 RepID=UPI002AB66094|nr:trypsin zeta-like [Musca vetustissima]
MGYGSLTLILVAFLATSLVHSLPLQDSAAADNSRIVGGYTTDIGAHGYQISLRKKSLFSPQDSYRHVCGGTIYSENVVITAAHCIIASVPSQFKVVAGTNFQVGNNGVMVPVKEIIMHENYDPERYDNDIAILVLASPLPLNGFTIRSIELIDDAPAPGSETTITGWGAVWEGGPTHHYLQEVKIPVVSHEDCNYDYGGLITEKMFCAGLRGVGGKDACQGDSGGPLTIRNKLAGVVSWGAGCARPEYPGVYANVWTLKSWILEKVAANA